MGVIGDFRKMVQKRCRNGAKTRSDLDSGGINPWTVCKFNLLLDGALVFDWLVSARKGNSSDAEVEKN
jgi:hypothetical protein